MPLNYYEEKTKKKIVKKCKICHEDFELEETDNISRPICYNPSCIQKYRELRGKGELPKEKKPYKTHSDYSKGTVYVLNEKEWQWEREER